MTTRTATTATNKDNHQMALVRHPAATKDTRVCELFHNQNLIHKHSVYRSQRMF